MKRFGILLVAVAGLLVALSMSGVMNVDKSGVGDSTAATMAAAVKVAGVADEKSEAPAEAPAKAAAPAAAPAAEKTDAAPAAPAAEKADAAPAAEPAAEKAAAAAPAAAGGDKKLEDGKWMLPDGSPTYNVVSEKLDNGNIAIKKVDWYTYSGWRRYHAECHVCHGPNAEGSSFAPSLADSLKTMEYGKFLQVVSSGQRRNVGGTDFIMPALGDNKNVMCYIDDLYIYLKARASGDLMGGRLSADQRDEKPQVAKEYEDECLK